MNKWDALNCRTDCGRCNHKGAPSVSKGSKVCLQLRKEIPETRDDSESFWSFFKLMFRKKGVMRATGKTYEKNKEDDDEEGKNGNT